MQTSNINRTAATPPELEGRFQSVRSFLKARKVTNYFSAFSATGVQFTKAEQNRIRKMWNSRQPLTKKDAPLVEAMERAVNHLEKAAA